MKDFEKTAREILAGQCMGENCSGPLVESITAALTSAYNSALEDAAKACDQYASRVSDFTTERRRGAGMCAAAIRTLKKGESKEEVAHVGCQYMSAIGHVCNKCGQLVHDSIVKDYDPLKGES